MSYQFIAEKLAKHETILLDGAIGTEKKMGATILGGCCGTTPEHIRQLNSLR